MDNRYPEVRHPGSPRRPYPMSCYLVYPNQIRRVCAGYPTGFLSDGLHHPHMDWGRIDPQLDVYVPSVVNPSGGMSLAPPRRHQPIASCDPGCSQYPSPVLGKNPVQTIRSERTPSEFDSRTYRFRSLDPSEKILHIPGNTGVPLSLCWYTRTQSWSWAPNCSGYGSWITTTHQEQLISFITIHMSWGASPESGT